LAPRTNQKLEILAGAGTVTPILSKAVVERVNTKKVQQLLMFHASSRGKGVEGTKICFLKR
jgi:hypothetical protein